MRIDPDAERFGAILRQLREQRGWTRQKLAQRAGMTPTYIGILEYGGNTPSLPGRPGTDRSPRRGHR
jgi:ribosome-binding protein aMBF1 (putative translation factor)